MLVDQFVLTKWNNDISRYQSLGYEFTGYKTDLWVKPEDLSKSSSVIVTVMCTHCSRVYRIAYANYISNLSRNSGVYRCRPCRYSQSKHAIEEVRKAFSERGLFLITSEYPGSRGTLHYLCYNHMDEIQTTTWGRFSSQGSGCPYCFSDWCSTNYFGENNPNYRGGKNTLVKYLRTSNPKWRPYVLKQYNYTCVISGNAAEHVHHTESYANKVRAIVEADLGIRYHRLVDKYSTAELQQIRKLLYEWEYTDGVGVPLTKALHVEFHDRYSNQHFTLNNFKEFYKLKTNLTYLNLGETQWQNHK